MSIKFSVNNIQNCIGKLIKKKPLIYEIINLLQKWSNFVLRILFINKNSFNIFSWISWTQIIYIFIQETVPEMLIWKKQFTKRENNRFEPVCKMLCVYVHINLM